MNIRHGGKRTVEQGRNTWQSNVGWTHESVLGLVVNMTIVTCLDPTMMTGPASLVRNKTNLFYLSKNHIIITIGKYEDSFDHWSRADENLGGIGAAPADPSPVHVDRNLTGDEAFQRRLALSSGVRHRSPLPYSVAESTNVSTDETAILTSALGSATPVPAPRVLETGEEAYLRRLAMSQNNAVPSAINPPPSPSPPPLAYNPFAPPSVPPPPPGPPATVIANAFEERARAAAAIAAKLGALPAPTESADEK